MEKTKEDYHSGIEYVFTLAPVGEQGGFAYLSPAEGIAVNHGSPDFFWSMKFINFLFQPENNEIFAEEFNVIPNTNGAVDYIRGVFYRPDNNISHLGEVTFDYDFYGIVTKCLVEISKGNNTKYMKDNLDGTFSLYPLEYYLNNLEESMKSHEE